MQSHLDGIRGHFSSGLSNGYLVSMNGLIHRCARAQLRASKLDALRQNDAASVAYLMNGLIWASLQRLLREAALMQLPPAVRYRTLIDAQPALESSVSQKQIAAWLGITPVALSRIRRRLKPV